MPATHHNSRLTADFHRYLPGIPAGEYAELARLRIESLEKHRLWRLRRNGRHVSNKGSGTRRAGRKTEKAAEQREAAERALAQPKHRRKRRLIARFEAAKKARLASQLAEIKSEAEISRAAEAVKVKKKMRNKCNEPLSYLPPCLNALKNSLKLSL